MNTASTVLEYGTQVRTKVCIIVIFILINNDLSTDYRLNCTFKARAERQGIVKSSSVKTFTRN